ncbi:Ferredoxin--NADP reductase [Rickettsiales bacterium Ac37b]|nr:Ferredoxin--NADP reductase [Rickettsiales bacterium Ac37b]
MNKIETDIVIIGAGPVGLFAIFEAGMLKMKCHVIDTLEFIGGQCKALYPEKPIYDIPGYPIIQASDLIDNLIKQAEPFDPVYHLGERVEKIEQIGQGFCVITSKDKKIYTNSIIIAAGCGAFGPNRPPLDHLEEYENKSVFYMVDKKENFRDKDIVIAGGGDSAIDWALNLAGIARNIYLLHRRPKFRCAPESLDRLNKLVEQKLIELVIPYQLSGLEGQKGVLTNVIVKDLNDNYKTLSANYLLAFFGLAMELGPIATWGLNLDHQHIQINPQTFETNVKGIFAIGDIVSYPGKLKLILTGFSEAASAAHAIYTRVHPNEALHFEYSTTKGLPV